MTNPATARYRRSTPPVWLPASTRTLTRPLLLRPDLAGRPPQSLLTELARRAGTPAARRGVGSGLDEFTRQVLDAAIRPEPPAADDAPGRCHRADVADAEAALRLVRDVADLRAVEERESDLDPRVVA